MVFRSQKLIKCRVFDEDEYYFNFTGFRDLGEKLYEEIMDMMRKVSIHHDATEKNSTHAHAPLCKPVKESG